MMFRSLFFIAPLASADEQTAMLQLNRRGEVAQHSVNDALMGSLEESLMSKDPEKPSDHAMCTYYLRTVNADILLQKMSQLKGADKTQQLLQRAMESVGEESIRNLEENLMSKDDDKKTEVKDSEKKLSPCEVLNQLRHAFKHNMNNYREVRDMTRDTGHKVGSLVEETVKKSLDAALAVLKKDKTKLADAKKELKAIDMASKLKEIQEHKKDEVKKSWEAIENGIKELKGSKMATTLKGKKDAMETAIKKYENAAITTIDTAMKDLFTTHKFTKAPTKKDKDGKDVPAAGFTDADVEKVFTELETHMAKDEGKAKDALNKGIEILKKYIDYVFEQEADNVFVAFADIWKAADVLATPAAVQMKAPPKDIGDDLFWQQASAYLNTNTHVESVCKHDAYDAKKPNDFVPRKVCQDGAEVKCEDEMLYLAKKKSADAKDVCTKIKAKTIGKDLKNDAKLSSKEFKAISELSFMADNDGKTCENWEKVKDACDSITA